MHLSVRDRDFAWVTKITSKILSKSIYKALKSSAHSWGNNVMMNKRWNGNHDWWHCKNWLFYTVVADRLRTVSWSNYGHPTCVVNLVYGPNLPTPRNSSVIKCRNGVMDVHRVIIMRILGHKIFLKKIEDQFHVNVEYIMTQIDIKRNHQKCDFHRLIPL